MKGEVEGWREDLQWFSKISKRSHVVWHLTTVGYEVFVYCNFRLFGNKTILWSFWVHRLIDCFRFFFLIGSYVFMLWYFLLFFNKVRITIIFAIRSIFLISFVCFTYENDQFWVYNVTMTHTNTQHRWMREFMIYSWLLFGKPSTK